MAVGKAVGYLTLLGSSSAVISMVSSIVTAHFFGTTRALEVFFAASQLQSLAVSLAQAGQVNEILIPLYHSLKEKDGPNAAHAVYSAVINWMLVLLMVICTALWFLSPMVAKVVVPGFSPVEQVAVGGVFRWLLPLLPLQIVASLLQGVLNAERRFGSSEAFSGGIQILGLAGLVLLAGRMGTDALVVALWINQGLLFCIYLALLRGIGFRHQLVFQHPSVPMSTILVQISATFAYLLCTQVYTFALSAGMSYLPQGSYAVFTYVTRIYTRISGVLLGPVATVFFTHFSEASAKGSEAISALVGDAMSRNLTIGCMAVIGAVVSSRSAVELAWGSKLFAGEQLDLAADLLVVFAFLFFLAGAARILRKLASAFGEVKALYARLCVAQIASGLLSLFLPRQFGVAGAAGVLVLNQVFLLIACTVLVRRALPHVRLAYSARDILTWMVTITLATASGLGLFMVCASKVPSGRFWKGGTGLLAGCLAMAVALAVARRLGMRDVIRMVDGIPTFLRRSKRAAKVG